MGFKDSFKTIDKGQNKTTGLYRIAAKIIKNVKSGSSFKTQLYQAQYPNKLTLNAVLMNVFKWEKIIDVLIEKSNILEKENNMDRELLYVLITELMWSKFGLKGNAKNILAIKKYKPEFLQLMKENELEKLTTSIPTKDWKPRYFRVNTLVTTLEEVLKKLADLKFKKLKSPKTYTEFLELLKSDQFKGNTFVQDVHIKELLVFNSKVKFYNLEDYNNGSLIIQDKASCLAAHLLNPETGSTVLDMCAAPGMKTSHLAAIMQNTGKLYAVDRCKDRFNVLQKMLEKYSVKNAETFNLDALKFPYYDDVKYILVDPSCSGSGIVDRVRNDSSEQNENFQRRLKKLANVHAQLLNHALRSFPNLERLVYSTCSANHEENEAVVDEALSVNGKFKLLDCTKMVKGWTNKGAPGYDCSEMCLNAVPSVDYTNGFFIAVFIRREFDEKEEEKEEKQEEENQDEEEKEEDNMEFAEVEENMVLKITDKVNDKDFDEKEEEKQVKQEEENQDEEEKEEEDYDEKKVEDDNMEFAEVEENMVLKITDKVNDKDFDEKEEEKQVKHEEEKEEEDYDEKKVEFDNMGFAEVEDNMVIKINDKVTKNKIYVTQVENNAIESTDEETKINNKKVWEISKSSIKADKKASKVEKIKQIENTPEKKSKNVKRRERRLKLELATGKVMKTKKSKRAKSEVTEECNNIEKLKKENTDETESIKQNKKLKRKNSDAFEDNKKIKNLKRKNVFAIEEVRQVKKLKKENSEEHEKTKKSKK